MKDVEALMLQYGEQLKDDAVFIRLVEAYQNALQELEQAKAEKSEAKSQYQSAVDSDHGDEESLLEALTEFRKSKYRYMFFKAGYQLARYKLERWMDAFDVTKNSA